MNQLTLRFTASLRDASRQLIRDPLFSVVLVLTIGIGIATATAIFTVARGVLLRPLPYTRPDALVSLQEFKVGSSDFRGIAAANLSRYRSARSIESITAFSYTELVLSDGDNAERILGAAIDADFERVIGAGAAVGRGINEHDGGPAPAHVAVLADALWRRRYGRDTAVVGRSISIDGETYTVIGVMAPAFEFPRNPAMNRDAELWVPREPPTPMMERRGVRNLTTIARLRPGVSREEAQTELDVGSALAVRENPRLNDGWRTRAIPLRDAMVGAVRPAILALAASVAALLVISWVNACAAVLARLSARRSAFEVRLALGAGMARIRQLVLAEAFVGAIVALLFAVPISGVVRRSLLDLAPIAMPRQAGVTLDGQAVAFATFLALLSAAVIGLGSASWLSRLDGSRMLTTTARTVIGSMGRTRAVAAFIIVQVALGTVLLGTTSRMYGTYARLNRVDPGFSAGGVTTATIALSGMRYRDRRARSELTEQFLEQVRALPGIDHAAVTSLLPLSGGLMSSEYRVDGAAPDSSNIAALRAVSTDFFTTFGIPVQGRAINEADNEGSPSVAVVNASFVRRSLPGTPPIGATVHVRAPGTDSAQTFQIVGVAADTREMDLVSPATPIIYFSDRQASFPHAVIAVKARGRVPMSAIRQALHGLDPSLALDDVASLESRVRSTYAMQIFVLALLAVFSASGATLVAIGVYGSVSFVVAAEMRSIGVRLALGATPVGMLLTVIGRVTLFGGIGCALGLGAVIVAPRVLGLDPIVGGSTGVATIGGVAVLVVAIAAAVRPALRASAADPATVLRA